MTTRSAALAPASAVDWRWLAVGRPTCAWSRMPGRGRREHGGPDGQRGRPCRGSQRIRPAPTPHRVIDAARSFTFQTMHKWGVTDRADDVAAVVTELLTNAIRHALPQRSSTPPGRWRRGRSGSACCIRARMSCCAQSRTPAAELPELRAARLAGRVRPRPAGGRRRSAITGAAAPRRDQQGKVVWGAFATTLLAR